MNSQALFIYCGSFVRLSGRVNESLDKYFFKFILQWLFLIFLLLVFCVGRLEDFEMIHNHKRHRNIKSSQETQASYILTDICDHAKISKGQQ